MASLLKTLQVKQVAFEWNNTLRIYRMAQINVFSEADRDEWEKSNGTLEYVTQGEWLFFQIASPYWQRLSPIGDDGNDRIDILNALEDAATTVSFYPIYDVDNTIKIDVKPVADRRSLLKTGSPRKTLFAPSGSIECQAISRVDSIPTWLRMTRER